MDKQNSIYQENTKQGTSDWKLSNPAINREIEGYASKSSVALGETIDFFVNTMADLYSITFFRMGWYQGLGARKMTDTVTRKGISQSNTVYDKKTGFIECNWSDPYSLSVPKDWTTGIYVARLQELKSKMDSYVIFVVRKDEAHSDITFQLPVTTYQAYNYWGGKSLYDWGSGSDKDWGTLPGERAQKVSFNRPYARSNNLAASYGMGAGEFFTNIQPNTVNGYPISSASWDYNMVRWLEKNGYDIRYITNLDTHERPSILKDTKVFMSHGHDEYWSYEMRSNVKEARDQGVNLAFFSSNTMFWQIRLEKKLASDSEPRTMVCFKDAEMDPIKGERSTVNFRDIEELKGEAEIIGIQYVLDPVHADLVITNPNHWIFNNTGLKKGNKIKGLLGYEVDSVQKDSPKNVVILGESPCRSLEKQGFMEIPKNMVKRLWELTCELKNRLKLSGTAALFSSIIFSALIMYTAFIAFELYGIQALLTPILLILVLGLFWYIKIINSNKIYTHMTIYDAPSGAKVFATGSMQWVWGLDDFNVPQLRKSYYSKKAEIITENLLKEFGAEKNVK